MVTKSKACLFFEPGKGALNLLASPVLCNRPLSSWIPCLGDAYRGIATEMDLWVSPGKKETSLLVLFFLVDLFDKDPLCTSFWNFKIFFFISKGLSWKAEEEIKEKLCMLLPVQCFLNAELCLFTLFSDPEITQVVEQGWAELNPRASSAGRSLICTNPQRHVSITVVWLGRTPTLLNPTEEERRNYSLSSGASLLRLGVTTSQWKEMFPVPAGCRFNYCWVLHLAVQEAPLHGFQQGFQSRVTISAARPFTEASFILAHLMSDRVRAGTRSPWELSLL